MPFLITKASNMHGLLILLVISLANSVPVEEDTHPDGNLLDSATYETVVYEESTEALVGENTDGPVLAAIDKVIQQLNETRNESSKPKTKSRKTLVVPKEVTVSSGSIQSVANETGRRQSKRVRFDDDGIQVIEGVYKPDDPNDKKTYRNARVINNQLIENSTVNWAEVSGRNGRFFGDDTPVQISDSLGQDTPQSAGKTRYPDFYYRSYYNDEDQSETEELQTSTTTKNPFGYSPSFRDSSAFHYVPFKDSDTAGTENSRHGLFNHQQHYKQGRELAVSNDNQQYVVRQHLYRNGDGSAFMVPVPYPTNNGFQYDRSPVQYQPYATYKEKSKAEMMKDKVGEIVAKVHDFTRPVVDPLKEAGDKISYNLGLPEKVSHFQSRLSKASHDPKTMVVAGGAAAVLGTIGAGLLLGSAAAGRSAKKLKQSRNTATAHNITRRDVDEEFQIEPEQIELDTILKKLDSSQNQLLEEMHKTGFLRSIEGPCGKAVMCQTLASDTSDYQLSLIRRRAALFAELLDGSEAQHLRKSIDGIVDAAKQGNCSIFDCEGEKLSDFLQEQSEIPR